MFPYPMEPEDWQSAYTRDQAFKDSARYSDYSSLALLAGALIIAGYIGIRVLPLINFKMFPLYMWGIIALVVIILVFLLLAIVQMGATYFSTRFFSEFYRPPDGVIPSKLINYRLFGRLKLPPPLNMFSQFKYVIVKDGQIEKPDKWAAWASQHVGGPITLIVFDGCALYLERGNRFSRVVGPGNKIPFLEWYETIKYVVDLRPKVKVDSFNVWTKDGIKIKLTARVTCRIGDPIKKDPGSELVYPYDPIAVKKAIERYALRWPNPLEEPSEFTWIDAVWGQVTGIVPGYIGSRMLDDLLMAERQSGQILSPEAVKELIGKLNQASNGFGVYVLDFQIQNIEVPARVTKQQEENWKAERQGMATVIDGQAKAFNIRSREKARAEAQRDLILAIADGLEKNTSGNYAEPLLLSLSGVLDESLQDPYIRATIAGETLDTLEKLQKILDRPSHNG
jgi:regulator of protease activity HflC (stomatin/prohibitin superfamily)